MDLVAREQFNRMVVFKDGAVSSIPIPAKLQQVRVVDVASRYDVDRCCAKYSVLE
jgi:hypothetical protein